MVTFVGWGTKDTPASGATSVVVPLTSTGWTAGPSAPVAAGDLIILVINIYSGTTAWTWPTGFVQQTTAAGTNASRVATATKIADGTEGASLTVSFGAVSTFGGATAYVLRGVSSATPLHTATNIVGTSASPRAVPAAVLTIGGPTDLTVYGYGSTVSGNTNTVTTMTVPGTLANPAVTAGNGGSGTGMGMGWGINVSAPGTATATNATSTMDTNSWAMDFAVSAAPSGLIPQQLKQRVAYQVLGSRPVRHNQASYRG